MKTEKTAAAEVKNNLSLPDFNQQQLYIGQYHFFSPKNRWESNFNKKINWSWIFKAITPDLEWKYHTTLIPNQVTNVRNSSTVTPEFSAVNQQHLKEIFLSLPVVGCTSVRASSFTNKSIEHKRNQACRQMDYMIHGDPHHSFDWEHSGP